MPLTIVFCALLAILALLGAAGPAPLKAPLLDDPHGRATPAPREVRRWAVPGGRRGGGNAWPR